MRGSRALLATQPPSRLPARTLIGLGMATTLQASPKAPPPRAGKGGGRRPRPGRFSPGQTWLLATASPPAPGGRGLGDFPSRAGGRGRLGRRERSIAPCSRGFPSCMRARRLAAAAPSWPSRHPGAPWSGVFRSPARSRELNLAPVSTSLQFWKPGCAGGFKVRGRVDFGTRVREAEFKSCLSCATLASSRRACCLPSRLWERAKCVPSAQESAD